MANAKVMGFGCNVFGQIGNRRRFETSDCNQPVLMLEMSKEEEIMCITAGWSESVIITHDRSVEDTSSLFCWGKLSQEGLPSCSVVAVSCSWDRMLLLSKELEMYICSLDDSGVSWNDVKHSDNENFSHISCGDTHHLAITRDGRVGCINLDESNLLWCFSYLPTLQSTKISQVSCGKEHAVLLSSNGEVFSFGNGSRGQLGHGTVENENEPRVIEALQGLIILSLAAGGWHSMVVSDIHDIYSWGWNESCQLGISNNDVGSCCATPTPIDIADEEIRDISCGSRHSAYVTGNGKLYTWGWGKYGQLGHGLFHDVKIPQVVEALSNYHVVGVICGFWHTLVTVISES